MPFRRCAAFLSACTPALFLVTAAAAQSPSPPPAYVVLGAKGSVARAIMIPDANKTIAACPPIEVDGTAKQMTVRAEPDEKFNIRVCEYLLEGAARARIGDQELPLPPSTVSKIAVFGDTGCRIKVGKDSGDQAGEEEEEDEAQGKNTEKVQDCESSTLWPFKTMSKTIAELKPKPDLVIHVGDYYYRESACPPDHKQECDNSPHGDNWPAWDADFFAPGADLLKAAPWIVTRGNHEICDRGGEGYARLLDPRPVSGGKPPTCEPFIDQYTIKVGGRSFIMLDSSDAADECACNTKHYVDQFKAMNPEPGTWLVTHKPIWGFTNSKNKDTGERELGIRNMTLQAALKKKFKNVPPAGIDLVLSGHIHLWEALSFEDGRSPQFVLGSGGTDLAHKLPKNKDLQGQKIGGTTIAAIASEEEFGYTLFEPSKNGGHWNATFYDPTGEEKIVCRVEPNEVTCK
jgi:hypothetical protein